MRLSKLKKHAKKPVNSPAPTLRQLLDAPVLAIDVLLQLLLQRLQTTAGRGTRAHSSPPSAQPAGGVAEGRRNAVAHVPHASQGRPNVEHAGTSRTWHCFRQARHEGRQVQLPAQPDRWRRRRRRHRRRRPPAALHRWAALRALRCSKATCLAVLAVLLACKGEQAEAAIESAPERAPPGERCCS